MKKSILLDHSCKKTRHNPKDFDVPHVYAVIGLYRIPLEFLPLTRFSLDVALNVARRFYLSRSSRARFYDILESPFSFPRGANASYFPVVIPFVVSFDYRHETRRLFLETLVRVFLFHLLNVCGTRVSTASLSQIIAAGIFFDLTRSTRPDLIFRDILTVCIMIYLHAYNCHPWLSVVWKSRRARRWKSFEVSRTML